MIEHLPALNPGIVNRFGFLYGGPDPEFQANTATTAAAIREKLPRSLLGSAINEHLYVGVRRVICGGGKIQTFDIELPAPGQTGAMLSQAFDNQSDLGWIDPTNESSYKYMLCLGEFFIDNGITMIHFENATGVMNANANPALALSAYRNLKSDLTAYANARHRIVYFGATPDMAQLLDIDYTYSPLDVNTTEPVSSYYNKIMREGIGVGFSFKLSLNRIIDTLALVSNTRAVVMFYVDNWRAGQDDLTALMELDARNRRYMLKSSARIARDHGVYFIPPLNHCYGCVPNSDIVDLSELANFTDKSGHPGVISEYDARVANDLATVKAVLTLQLNSSAASRWP